MTCVSITTADYRELLAYTRYRFAGRLRMLRLPAHEIVHEVYLRAVKSEAVWKSRSHFRNWSRLAASHAIIDKHREAKRHEHLLDDPAFQSSESAAATPLDLDLALQRTVLAARMPRLAEAIRLRYFEGLSVRETAERLGISERTVKRDVAEGLRWLRSRMDT